ncbi:MAG: hypothetical protein HXX11_03255 [Desulfuromonadales bacterium]|nr:hypothetical protein [Desulfuromonadales bacterium]
MKKIMITLIVGSLLSAALATPVFADGRDGFPHIRGGIFNPLWPVAVALAIPAAVVGTVASLSVPEPVGYGYAPHPLTVAQPVYSAPPAYYAPRVYVSPRGYYAPRAYYPERYYRTYRHGW